MQYKNQIFQIIKVTLVFLVSLFCWLNFSYAESVDAWVDQNVNIWDIVNLNWTLNWFPSSWCNFRYNWVDDSGRVTINNSWTLDSANFDTSIFSWATILKIALKVTVNSEQMTHDSCGKTWIYEDFVYINVIDNNSSGSGSTTWTTTHHSSYSSKMRAEVDRIFKNLKKIKLKLHEDNKKNKYFYKLAWNYIWWDWQIDYELQYSKTKYFKEFKKITTKSRFWSFYKKDLPDFSIYFFRVKAVYKNKESPYSNIVSITNKDNPLRDFKIKCKNCNIRNIYSDVFDWINFLIDKNFNVKCNWCDKKKIDYLFSDIFIYNKKFELKVNKNNYCRTRLNFEDIFNYEKKINFRINCNKNNKTKTNFNF